jgi:hypothetical protein
MFRRNINCEMLARIFEPPRIHTGVGYQTTSSFDHNKSLDNPAEDEEAVISQVIRKLEFDLT